LIYYEETFFTMFNGRLGFSGYGGGKSASPYRSISALNFRQPVETFP